MRAYKGKNTAMLFRRLGRKSISASFVVVLLVSFIAPLGASFISAGSAYADPVNCDDNAVVTGGTTGVSDLQHKYVAGASCVSDGKTYTDTYYSIQDIYNGFGITSTDINTMGSDTVTGYVTRGGDVYAGSTLVATNAITGGRQNFGGSTEHHYGATTFYERTPNQGFGAGVTQLSAMVVMKNGVFQYAIFFACGNPVIATPTTKPTPPPTPPPAPYYSCVQLSGSIPSDSNQMERTFTATASYGNGATFTSADFYFGDGNSKLDVVPITGSKTVSYTYAYATAGSYSAQAVLHFEVSGKAVTAAACPAMVTATTPPTPECKPGVPAGSPMCTPCQYNASLPSNSPECVAPTTSLPNTGAGDTIGIFAAVAIVGFLVYRQVVFRKHRATFLAAERGTSLPLVDPLNEGPQLHVAPQQHRKKHSLRRPRQY
jgi:hypothetical protein